LEDGEVENQVVWGVRVNNYRREEHEEWTQAEDQVADEEHSDEGIEKYLLFQQLIGSVYAARINKDNLLHGLSREQFQYAAHHDEAKED
jgi:hypothetical protein